MESSHRYCSSSQQLATADPSMRRRDAVVKPPVQTRSSPSYTSIKIPHVVFFSDKFFETRLRSSLATAAAAAYGGRRCRVEQRRYSESDLVCCKGGVGGAGIARPHSYLRWQLVLPLVGACGADCDRWGSLLMAGTGGGTVGGSPCYHGWGFRSTGSATRVRQSVLYSDRRGPQGRQGRRVKEHTGEVDSSEPGHTDTDLPQFKALTLNTTPPTLESADRAVVHAGDMDSYALDSTNAKQPVVREGLSPRSQERWQRIDQYLAEHTFDDMWEGMVAMKNGFCNPPKKVPFPNKKSLKKLPLPDSLQSPCGLDAQSFQTTTQCEESTAQIIENGKQWMKKEVMEAFKKYIKETDRFRCIDFELDELLHQCFSVETYEKIFHHYNFTVKMKQAGSDKWSSILYFAQVKKMYGRKFYFCYPLDPFEDGMCHACKNQGMDALRHPAVPIGYETGQADTGCPFFEDDSDDDGDRAPDDDGWAWAFSKAFLGGAPY